MIKKIKANKKTFSLAVLLVVLAVISYMNYSFFASKGDALATIEENAPLNAELVNAQVENEIMTGARTVDKSFFTEYRTQREQKRSENIEILKSTVNDEDEPTESIDNARNEIVYLVQLSENEISIENQIKAKGFEDCIVFIHDGYANVVVSTPSITAQQAAQIQDIVNKNCEIDYANISVATTSGGGQ